LQLHELIKFEKFLGTIHIRILCVNTLTRLIYKRILFYLFYVYGLRTSLFKLREEHRLGMYDNCVPRTVCRPKEMEVPGSWKELFDGELHNVYFAKHYWGGLFLISNFCRVLNAVCFLLGNSPAFELPRRKHTLLG
jgi:hypothetical protein